LTLNISNTVQHRAILTTADWQEVVCDLSNVPFSMILNSDVDIQGAYRCVRTPVRKMHNILLMISQ